jgi:hypothetical protein
VPGPDLPAFRFLGRGCWPPLSVQMTAPFRMPMSGT